MADSVSSSTSSNLLSGSIKWSGLASGTDFSKVVDQLVQIERTTITRLSTWKQSWVDKNTSINGLTQRMVALKSNSQDMADPGSFYVRQVSSSNSSVVTATVTSQAKAGTHSLVVGENIPAQAASKSYDSSAAVGGSGDLVINIGTKTLTISQGAGMGDGTWNPTVNLDQLALDIKAADSAKPVDQQILNDVYTVSDKTRAGVPYKRLVITAKNGGNDNQTTISGGPATNIGLDANSVDAVYEKTWLFSTSHATSGGTYSGRTNKTFTFVADTTGEIGQDDITFKWADPEGNSGSFTVKATDWQANHDKTYDVLQGVTVKFSAGRLASGESFTIDVYNPTLQRGQNSGLAQAEQRVHQGFPDLITPVHSGTQAEFIYSYGGVENHVQVADGTTLQGLADLINSDINNRGVQASIINDGQGTATSYHLVLTGQRTGAAFGIDLLPSPNPLSSFVVNDTTFSTPQRASDSMIKLDGFPDKSYKFIQRPTNTVSDIITGMSLELQDAGQATITVSNNINVIKDKISQLIQSVNFVQDYIRQETKYDPETKKSGVMIGNYTFDIVRNAVNESLYKPIAGLQAGVDTYTHLSQIGIKTDPDNNGAWTVDSTKLLDALKTDLDGVARLFIKDIDHSPVASTGVAETLRITMASLSDTKTGITNVLVKNYDNIISGIDKKIEYEEKRIALYKTRLEEKFSKLETLLGQLNNQSTAISAQLAKLTSSSK